MDLMLPSKNIYDTYKDEIWKDLGPLDPDWFVSLTAQTFTNEGLFSDQDDLCANQEGNFKTPFDKTAVESQLFSTPKVFRQSRIVSPETGDDHSFTSEQERETLPWTTQSPCLFQLSKERVPGAKNGCFQPHRQEIFDPLHTPQKSPVSYSKHISESLGVQINQDISWTSSLNTPPAVPSTLILTTADESPCPVGVSAEKDVVFVRKLFPSLSNASKVVSPNNSSTPTVSQGVVSPEAGLDPESHHSPLNDSGWKQKLPDAIEDGAIRKTVASVLDGAENVLSIFFSNSSSALRKVKSEKIKRKQINPTREHGICSTDVSSTNDKPRTADLEPGRIPSSPPVKTGDVGITQWSPLSLSEIPPSTVDASCHDNSPATQAGNIILTDQLRYDSGQLTRPLLKLTDSGFTKKKRTFVYTVRTSKPQIQGEEKQTQKMDSSPVIPDYEKEVGKSQNEAYDSCMGKNEVQKRGNLAEDILPPSVQAKVQDLDMSQLCKEFAQDFSQSSDLRNLSKVAEDNPGNGFSPSACLSAVKRAKQKAMQAQLHHDCNAVSDSGFQSAVAASACVTASSFVLPRSEMTDQSKQMSDFKSDIYKIPPFTSTNKGNDKDVLQETEMDAKLSSAIKESQTLVPDRAIKLHTESTSAQLPSKGTEDNINGIPLNGQAFGSLPEKTTVSLPSDHASGFKTASNKGIQISLANLQRAKHFFEENDGGKTQCDQPSKSELDTKKEMSHGSEKIPNTNSNNPPSSTEKNVDISCQLTASQKADVTELCTLLEEADSQFEFTQFTIAKVKQHGQEKNTSPQKVEKEFDTDLLSGIDFDDSFSSEEKNLAVTVKHDKKSLVLDGKTNCDTSNITSTSPGLLLSSAVKNENSSTEVASTTESCSHILSTDHKTVDRALHTGTSKRENNNPLLGMGFKTAGVNNLKVSKMCLSKARALFANVEENLVTSQTLPDKQRLDLSTQNKTTVDHRKDISLHDKEYKLKESLCSDKLVTSKREENTAQSFKNSKRDTTTCPSGFQMASGKVVTINAKAMQETEVFFKDCDTMDFYAGLSIKHQKSAEPLPGGDNKTLLNYKDVQVIKVNVSEELINDPENVNAGPAAPHTDVQQNAKIQNVGFKNASFGNDAPFNENPSTAKALSSLSCTTFKSIGSSAIKKSSNNVGFCTARGKTVSMSADAVKKAESLLNEINPLADANPQLKKQGDALRTGNLPKNSIQVTAPKLGGFQTARGKGVVISSTALKKAKMLLSECDEVGDDINVIPACSNMPVPGAHVGKSGFIAASSKPVAFSYEAIQKAKALFSDVSFSAEIPAVSDPMNREKKQGNAENALGMLCGFKTAGGAKVHVSQNNLLKAKHLLTEFDDGPISAGAMQEADAFFKDCDLMNSNNSMPVKQKRSIEHVSGSSSKKRNLSSFKQDQQMTISEEPAILNVPLVVDHEKMLHPHDVETHKDDFKNTVDSIKVASLHGNPSLMSKPLSSTLCTTSKNMSSSASNALVNGSSIPKARSLFNDSDVFEDTNKQKEETFSLMNGGFQTASGKGVTISSSALKQAKTLLSDCEGVEDTPTDCKLPVPGPPTRSTVFLAASGKSVAFSSEALQKAKSLFSDISFSAEIPAVSDNRNSDKQQGHDEKTEKIHCGFATAGGKKVHVSRNNLMKAKNLLTEDADGKCHSSNSYSTCPQDPNKPDLSRVIDVKKTCEPSNVSGNDMPTGFCDPLIAVQNLPDSISIKDKTHTDAFKLKEDKISPAMAGNLHDSPEEEMSIVLDYETNQTSNSKGCRIKRPQESSVLNVQSLNLSGWTETQQKFFAQEALDCTKALLEDEGLAGQSLSMTSENVPLQENPKSSVRSAGERTRTGKRSVEDSDIAGQPPLKRRLLEEFDRSVDGPKGSTLCPETSCPTGVMKDRRVFKYSVSLHPNITKPPGSGKNYTETRLQKMTPLQPSIPRDSRSAHPKTPAFVPPFLKTAKTESQKNAVLKVNPGTLSAFVPPFKKQRTIVQESSSKPQDAEDNIHHLFVTPFSCNTFVPPTKTTQSTTDGTGNQSKEDTQTVSFDGTINKSLNNQNLTVGCASEDSFAEASQMEDTLSPSQDIFQNLHNVELARDMQNMRIRKKKRQTIRPLPGSLFLTKTSGVSRIPLKSAVNGNPPARYTQKQLYGHGVHQHVFEITSETAESFRFNLQQFIRQEALIEGGGVQLGDGGWLIPSKDGTAGKEEFYRALCDTPGVDPKLTSEAWAYNHYRWIVWKQASMERSFPESMGSLCVTPEQLLLQLKYRYDLEVDHSRRPALRKIMEKDDTSAKTLVLCVCRVVSRGHSTNRQSFSDTKTPHDADTKVENPFAVVWLTDGWYAIKAQLDEPLTAMLHKGRVSVGGKLIIHGAQLVGSQDACAPLEAPESLMLKICANSSRPARWDTKLGFHKDPRPFLLPISSLYSNGGPVGCLDIVILRSYPIQWMERKTDGGAVFRSVRAEEKEARRHECNKQKAMEILFAKIQAEFEKEDKGNSRPQRRRRTISRQSIASLQDGEELYEAVGDDPAYLEAQLSERQLETLRSYRCSLMEKNQAELQDRFRRALENAEESEGSCPKRDVTPVWRLCVTDSMDQHGSVYQLNFWRPSSDLQSLLKEGCRFKVYNLTTSDGKKHVGNTTVQLTGTKKTQFQDLQVSQEWLSTHFQPRVSTHFVDLQNTELRPLCGEVDLTGYVISIVDGQGFSPAFYLTDGEMNFVKVRCFSSFAQSGLEDLVKPNVLLALSNLQLRGQSTSPTPVVYAGDLTVFSTNPKELHLQKSLGQLRKLVQGEDNFFTIAEEKLSHLVRSDGTSSVFSPALQTQSTAFTTVRRLDTKSSVTFQQPVRSLGSFTPVSRKPPAAHCSSEKDPNSLKMKRALDYLSRVPSHPPLSPFGSVASPCLNKTFNPPRRSVTGTPSTLKTVQTPAQKPVETPVEDEWVNDEELAMIDTQDLHVADLL